ncbi:fibronectin type III domain-containing protein 5 isoform X2 [Lontra canadensis]|uniref:fibronectin type III domain-containing protein 5 isoform X2 n=1 Tax=Lontra canadensis TaxID=76717 RepID=UPI0013F2D197|nr:fibronectin type III domain-containing protein 5 isoform X2 [Lontra canadensis]
MRPGPPRAALRLWLGCVCLALVQADSPSAPVNVTVRHLKANSAVVSWDVLEDEVVIGFAISQQEVNTTTRSCALWDLEEDTEYIVHVQAISIQGQSPASEPVLFKTPREAEKMASKNKDEVTMKEMGSSQQLRTGEVLIIVVVLFMWAGVIALFCRQYDIIKDNEPNNNKEKTKSTSETSTPEHQGGGLLRSKTESHRRSHGAGSWLPASFFWIQPSRTCLWCDAQLGECVRCSVLSLLENMTEGLHSRGQRNAPS